MKRRATAAARNSDTFQSLSPPSFESDLLACGSVRQFCYLQFGAHLQTLRLTSKTAKWGNGVAFVRCARGVLLVSVFAFIAGSLAAQSNNQQSDYHLTDDSAHVLYQHSSWAHGYVHGYQVGFHEGTIDYHMSHTRRDPAKIKTAHRAKDFCRYDTGNHKIFERGFKEGMKAGYSDAFAGRDYRASNEMEKLAVSAPVSADSHLDPVIGEGYAAGQRIGLDDGRRAAAYLPQKGPCPLNYAPPQCSGYRLGFQLGYSDGYHNQREPEEVRNAMNRH